MQPDIDLSDLLRSPEEIMQAQRDQMAKAAELEQRIAEVSGAATSDDERIAVRYSEADGLQELTLDPRALRMPSEDLAAELLRLVNAARDDAKAQIEEVIAEVLGDERPDAEELTEQTAALQITMDELMRDTMGMQADLSTVIERMRRLSGDD